MADGKEQYMVIHRAHPNIALRLRDVWGSAKFYPYVDELTQEKKRIARAGFAVEVLLALSELTAIHDARFPNLVPKRDRFWGAAFDQ